MMSNPNTGPNTGKPGQAKGLIRLWRAGGYSLAGIGAAYRHEAAFRQEVWLAVVLIPLAFWLPLADFFKALLLVCMLGVLVAELLNSAIEAVVDMVSPEIHPLAKRAKDAGSAAVLVALVILAAVWGVALMSLAG